VSAVYPSFPEYGIMQAHGAHSGFWCFSLKSGEDFVLRMYCDSASVSMGGGYLVHSRTNACKTPNVSLVKSTFNLTLTLNLTLNVTW